MLGAESILDIDRYVAALHSTHRNSLDALAIPAGPTPPMHENDGRRRLLRFGEIDIRKLLRERAIGHIAPDIGRVQMLSLIHI